ncbi:hypothetical protein F0919_03945 [Taibaiella lutea]|uniref:Dialkylresorcinol condensing enzyme DarA n=1 Tax=Taibaiella lutea TaxID=2608001 RepID=A0A5M6CS96_9BACT|nr:hypothetical protein [Taibaiella lutea]KAA5536832.1 hypothetical protein F0919_03945 [Taibaiella lutea]
MNKKILAICYSQTGQLADIIQNLTAPMIAAGADVEILRVYTEVPYPFPWTGKSFFAQMPDCVGSVPTKLKPIQLKHDAYDLVIFGYQAWFLSPSIPSNSILQDPQIRNIIKNTPVVTVTGARNMWLSAMERLKVTLREAQANLVGNIALVDKHPNFISFVTIFHWMFAGKKDRLWNIFPVPGVAEEDIKHTRVFGEIIMRYLSSNQWNNLQNELLENKAVVVKYNLMFIESKARKIFAIWAKIISKKKNKTAWLVAFKYYLIIALFVAAPIILTLNAILIKPFSSRRIKKQKEYYSGIK